MANAGGQNDRFTRKSAILTNHFKSVAALSQSGDARNVDIRTELRDLGEKRVRKVKAGDARDSRIVRHARRRRNLPSEGIRFQQEDASAQTQQIQSRCV